MPSERLPTLEERDHAIERAKERAAKDNAEAIKKEKQEQIEKNRTFRDEFIITARYREACVFILNTVIMAYVVHVVFRQYIADTSYWVYQILMVSTPLVLFTSLVLNVQCVQNIRRVFEVSKQLDIDIPLNGGESLKDSISPWAGCNLIVVMLTAWVLVRDVFQLDNMEPQLVVLNGFMVLVNLHQLVFHNPIKLLKSKQ